MHANYCKKVNGAAYAKSVGITLRGEEIIFPTDMKRHFLIFLFWSRGVNLTYNIACVYCTRFVTRLIQRVVDICISSFEFIFFNF